MRIYAGLCMTVFLALLPLRSYTQSTIYSATGGAWAEGSTWIGGTVPAPGDNAVITKGHTVSLATGSGETIHGLTIQAGGVLDARNKPMTVTGPLIVDGTYTSDDNSAKNLEFSGDTLGGSGTIAVNDASRYLNIATDVIVLPSTYLQIFGNIYLQDNVTLTNQGHVEVNGNIEGQDAGGSVWIQDDNSDLEVAGDLLVTGTLNAENPGNSVKYFLQGIQDLKTPVNSSYYNLELSGSDEKAMKADLVILNDLNISSGILNSYNFDIELKGDWFNESDFLEGNGTVTMSGDADQVLDNSSGEQLFGLTINKSAGSLILESEVTVSNTLTMISGLIDSRSGKLTLGTGLINPGAVVISGGHIAGSFERWINSAGTYTFPVGSSLSAQFLYITLNGMQTGGTLTAEFMESDPANAGLPLYDDPDSVFNAFVDGYWDMAEANGFALGGANDYNIILDGNGFSAFPINSSTRVLIRGDESGDWGVEGSHQTPLGSSARRSGMISIPAQFALGDTSNCSRPSTSSISGTDEVCTGSSGIAYSVVDDPPNTYAWIISGGTQAGGGNGNSITVDWGSVGTYGNVRVIESNSCTQGPPRDFPVTVHSIQPEEINGRSYVAEYTSAEPYAVSGISGYSYYWTITGGIQNPAGNGPSITVDWDSNGVGLVSVVAQMPGCPAAPASEMEVNKYVIIESIASGSWDDPSTWDCNCVPLPTENVRINNTHTVTLPNGPDTEVNHLIIQAGGTLNSNNKALYIHGDFTVNGTYQGGSKTLAMDGFGMYIDGTGNINQGIDLDANVYFTTTAVINISGGDVSLGNGKVISNYGSVTVEDNITGSDVDSKWVNKSNSTLGIGQSLLSTGKLDASAAGNVVNYNGAGAQSIKLPEGTYANLISSGNGTKSMTGDILVKEGVWLDGTAVLDVSGSNYSITLEGDWINQGGTFNEQSGRVYLNGTSMQTVYGAETFYDLELNNPAGLILDTSIIVQDSLIMQGGNIDPGADTLKIGTDLANPGALRHNSGTVSGKIERWVTAGSVPYEFPVGNQSTYRPALLTFTDLTPGSLVVHFIDGDPGESGLPLSEGTVTIDSTYSEGYWNMSAGSALATNDFDLQLTATDFTSYPLIPGTRILKRPSGGDWILDGMHAGGVPPDLFRVNLTGGISAAGTQFGVGHVECAAISVGRIITDVSCSGGNDGAIDVTVNGGTAPYTYEWGHGPVTEDVSNLAAGTYDLKVTDNDGCDVDSSFTVSEPEILGADVDSSRITCIGGNDGSIMVSIASGGGGTYEYSINGVAGPWQGSGSFNGLFAGTYDVRIRDAAVPACMITLDPALNLSEPNDFIPPVAVCKDTTVYLDASGSITIDSTYVDAGSTDNCDIATVSLDISTFNCADIGSNPVQLTVTDVNSNTSGCVATVTVLDTISPLVSCPGDQIENPDASCQFTLPDYTGMAGVIENCSVGSLVQSPVPGTIISGHGTSVPVTITATDGSGNTGECVFNVTLEDVTDPVAVCTDTTVYLDGAGFAAIDSSFIDAGSTDDCGIELMALDVSNFNCGNLGSNPVMFTVTDYAGNTDFCMASVTVLDTVSPVLTCPGDRDETVDTSENFTLPDYTPFASSSDNCTALPVLSQDPLPGTVLSGTGTIQPVAITADDGNGNTAKCIFNVTLVGPASPTIACPPDRDEYLDGTCQFAIPDYTGLATVTDADTVTQSPEPGTILTGSLQIITLTAKNAANDSAWCSFNLVLYDTIAPVLSCRSDTALVAAPGSCSVAVTGIAPIIAGDNCMIGVSYRIEGATAGTGIDDASGTVFNKGLSTVWYIAKDAAGNADSCSFTVNIRSTVVPPDNAIVDRDSLCAGDGGIMLSYSGGIMVEGGTARWYDDVSMMNPIGSGNPLGLSAPLISTEYYIRFEGTCDTSSAVSVRVEALSGSEAPVSANSDRNNICPGDGMITLSYSGGMLGVGAVARWYSDSALTQNIGSGNDLSIDVPQASTPYFVRFEGLCDTSTAAGFYLNVGNITIAPTMAAVDPDTVCPGIGSIVLSYSGGESGTGGTAEWYSDSLCTSHVGSGNDLILAAPPVTTTYYVRFEAECDTSAAVAVTVYANALPAPLFTKTVDQVCSSGISAWYVVSGLQGSGYTWTVTGGNIEEDRGDSILVSWGNTPGSYDLSVYETSVNGCQSEIISTGVTVSGPDVELGDDLEICGDETVEIIPTGSFTLGMWQDGSTGSSYFADTTELVSIQVFDDEGCSAFDSIRVDKYPQPVVDLGSDTSLCGESSIVLDAGNPGAAYLWSTGETTRQIEVFAGSKRIQVEVTYGMNCKVNDEIIIGECSLESRFADIPNLITPNGDGRNDSWIFYESAAYPDIVVEIYDRWGKLVFRSEPGYSNPWDGHNMKGKEVPMDSYHYIIRIGDEAITGTITVVR